MSEIKILFLAANPATTQHLQLKEEIRQIEANIRASEYRERLALIPKWGVHPRDLIPLLLDEQPEIVHFSGHADQSEIILEGESPESRSLTRQGRLRDVKTVGARGGIGEPSSVTHQGLVGLFKTLKDKIRIVVLNACSTAQQARAIAHFVDFAIGMSKEIPDAAAIAFAASFYGTIGFGRSVQTAFDLGKVELLLERKPGYEIPAMYVRKGMDAATTVLIDPGASPISQAIRTPDAPQGGPADHFRHMDLPSLERTLKSLSPSTFERFVATLDDAAIHLSHNASVSDNVSELLTWAKSPRGRGIEAIRSAFQDFWRIPPPTDLVSEKLAAAVGEDYSIQRSIGISAISQVMRAYDNQLDRLVTVKVLTDKKSEQLFDDAVRDVVKVTKHPNIVAVYGAALKKDIHYYIREYIEGPSLRSMLNEKGRSQTIAFIHQVLAAVGDAISFVQTRIENDIDIRPEHILIQTVPEGLRLSPSRKYNIVVTPDTVQVSALGRDLNPRAVANLIYSPPECLWSDYYEDKRDLANQYRLGIVGYEMLVGSEEFYKMARARSEILVKWLQSDEPGELPELPSIASLGRKGCPQFLSQAIERMTKPWPHNRFGMLSEAVNSIAHRDFDVEVARDSYRRILGDATSGRSFFEKFYSRFLDRCHPAAKVFQDKGFPTRPGLGSHGISDPEGKWPRQYTMLKNAIVLLLAFKMLGQSDEPTILRGIADVHAGYPPECFGAFRETLVETVIECDELSGQGLQRDDLRTAWENAIDPGVDYMLRHEKQEAR